MATGDDERELDLRDYFGVLRRRKGVIVLTALVVVGAALAFSYRQTPVYEGTAEVLVRPRASDLIFAPDANRTNDAQRALNTEIKVLESRTVQDAVRKKLRRLPDVSAEGAGATDVIAVHVQSVNAKRAASDANAYADTYVDVRRQQAVTDLLAAGQEVQSRMLDLQQQLNALPPFNPLLQDPNVEGQRRSLEDQRNYYRQQLDRLQLGAKISESGGGQVVSRAATPGSPVGATPVRNGLVALALGLVLGVGFAFLREYLDDTIKTKDDLERASRGLATVGIIPNVAAWKKRKAPYLVTLDKPASSAAEAYRTLRTSVQFLGLERPIHTLQVTSPISEEGKTSTLANLAVILGHAGSRVALLDCNLRRPRIHDFFGLSNEVGFTSVLLGTCPLTDALQTVPDQPRLALLASGPPPPEPSELLASNRFREVLEALCSRCDVVLIDSPSVLPVTDALVLSGLVDATLLVVAAGQTTKKALRGAIELLQKVDAPVAGTVFNKVGPKQSYAYGYADRYSTRGAGTRVGVNGANGRRQSRRAKTPS